MRKINKRHALASLALVSVGGLLIGCSAPGGSTDPLVIGSWGGDFDNISREHVVPAFNDALGDSAKEVVFDSTSIETRLTKVIAQIDSEAGDYDVLLLADFEVPRLIAEGALEKLDYSKMSRAEHLNPVLKNDYCMPQMYSALALTYNTDRTQNPPTHWADLWSDEYENRVGVYSNMSSYFFWLAAAAAADGDPGSDIAQGYPLIEQAGDYVRPFTSNEQLGQALISGEVTVGLSYISRTAQWNNAADGKLKAIIPAEGTIASTFWACIPANAKDKEQAYEFLNSFLLPEAQAAFAEGMGYAPTVDNAPLDPALSARITLSESDAARLLTPDLDALGAEFDAHIDMWNRLVVAG